MFKWLHHINLEELLKEYLSEHHLSASTRRLTLQAWTQIIEMIGNVNAKKVTPKLAAQVQATWQERLPSSNSARIYRKTVNPIWSWAAKRGHVKRNPFAEVQVPKAIKKQVRVFTPNEFRRLLDACQYIGDPLRWTAILCLARTTALRKSAIQNLTRDEICFEAETISTKEKIDTATTWRWASKDKEEQQLPLVPQVAALLTEILYRIPTSQFYVLLKPARNYHLLECKQLGCLTEDMAKYPISNFDRIFRKIKRRARVSGRFHDLRSTCLTGLCDVLNPNELRKFAGHTDVGTTMAYIGVQGVVNKARPSVIKALGTVLTPSHAR